MWADAALRSALVAAAGDADVQTRCSAIGGLVYLSEDEANRQPMWTDVAVCSALIVAGGSTDVQMRSCDANVLVNLACVLAFGGLVNLATDDTKQELWGDAAVRTTPLAATGDADMNMRVFAIGGLEDLAEDDANKPPMWGQYSSARRSCCSSSQHRCADRVFSHHWPAIRVQRWVAAVVRSALAAATGDADMKTRV